MFSVTNTGIWRRPSWTPSVSPTISGIIIEALDQVRITVGAPERCTALTFFISLGWTYGPFFTDLDIGYRRLPRITNLLDVFFLLRVL